MSTAHRRPCSAPVRICCLNSRERPLLIATAIAGKAHVFAPLPIGGRPIPFYNGGQVGRQEYRTIEYVKLWERSHPA
jgi:hypothetical protein